MSIAIRRQVDLGSWCAVTFSSTECALESNRSFGRFAGIEQCLTYNRDRTVSLVCHAVSQMNAAKCQRPAVGSLTFLAVAANTEPMRESERSRNVLEVPNQSLSRAKCARQ